MKNRTTSFCFLLFLILFAVSPANAQIQLGGLVDFEIRKGGSDSSPFVNQTPTDRWTLYMPYVRLFAGADISENWYVTSGLQSDYYYNTELSAPFFSVLNVNWMPIEDSDFTATFGRFVTPYGAYSERVLSSDNPFVHLPLSHSTGLPVSSDLGILSPGIIYSDDITALTMIYQRMYSQGIRISNRSDWIGYTLAATLAPASSYTEAARYDVPSFTGRLTLHPDVWGSIGFSFSRGPFMNRETLDDFMPDLNPADYTQTLLGTDLMISYHYYTFLLEYNWSRWEAPYIDPGGTSQLFDASVNHLSVEAVVNFPFFVGGYAGARYEKLISGDLSSGGGPYTSGDVWTYDRDRLEMLLGYKLHRNIIMKLSYLYSGDSGPDLDDNVFSLQLSVAY